MQRNKSVRCILVPQRGRLLILPGAIIAEVLYDQKIEASEKKGPNWLVGYIQWREQKIPLIDFAAMSSHRVAEPLKQTRALVISNIVDDVPDHYALVIDRVPRVESLDAAALEQSKDRRDEDMYCVAARVFLDNRPCDIPDLDTIGSLLSSL